MRIHLAIIFFIIIFAQPKPANSVQENKPEYKTVVKTLHFDIYFPDELSDLAVYTAKIAEESYVYLADYFQHELTKTVQVILHYKTAKNHSNNGMRIDISFTGSYLSYHEAFTRELVYIFQRNILFKSNPGWHIPSYGRRVDITDIFMDSMAYYLSAGFDEKTEMIIRDIINNNNYIRYFKVKSLKNYRNNISDEIGRSFFFYLEKEYGNQVIADLLLNIRDFDDIYKAIEVTVGKAIADVNNNWADFYKQRYTDSVAKESIRKEIIPLGGNAAYQFPIGIRSDNTKLIYLTIRDDVYSIKRIDFIKNKNEQLFSFNKPHKNSSFYKETGYQSNDLPSTSKDHKILTSVKQFRNNIIIIYDLASGKTIRELAFPFIEIKDATISPDGKLIAFIGMGISSADIYLYNINDKKLIRVTNDYFTKRYPKISEDNSFIIFSSNENKDTNIKHQNFKLIRINLNTNVKTVIVDNNAKNIHPYIIGKSEKFFYSSDVSGTYNIYYYDMNTGRIIQITDTSYGAFYPISDSDGKILFYSAYDNFTYKLMRKEVPVQLAIKEKHAKPDYKLPVYTASYFNLNDIVLSNYSNERNIDFVLRGSGIAWNDSFAGLIKIKADDILKNHTLNLCSDFLYYSHDKREPDFNLTYRYKKYRAEFGLGSFYSTHPSRLDFINDHNNIITFYPDNINTSNYGFFTSIAYPIIKNTAFAVRGSYTAYEDLNLFYDNIYLKEIHFSLNYDNIMIDKVLPFEGSKFNITYSYAFSEGDRDISFSTITSNFLQIFHYDKSFIFSFKGSAGKIFGKNDNYFKYYLGGFNTIRGHELFAYKGQNYFLMNLETKLIFFDKITINWPAIIKFYDISIAIFADFGSAWNNDYKFRNNETGEFKDLKSAFGTGLRFLLQNHLVFKLDAAWPYYYKSFGKREIISGFELRY